MFKAEKLKYNAILSLDDFVVEKGKITCLVGKSGGGKTTLLRLLNKMISPTSGTLYYENEDLESLDSIYHRRDVVLLSQKPFIFNQTVQDNLEKALKFHGKSVDEDKLHQVLKEVKLDKKLSDNAKTLSGGEAQRLALARVLLLDAKCILLDEPSSALDDDTEQLVVQSIVDYVKNHRKTMVMVTHSKAVAKQHGDVIYTIEQGIIKECERRA